MRQIIFFFIVFASFAIRAQQSTIKYIDTKIEVDGEFSENVWQQLPEHTGFYNYLPTDIGLAENQTQVKLFHNGEYLYVSAIYNCFFYYIFQLLQLFLVMLLLWCWILKIKIKMGIYLL